MSDDRRAEHIQAAAEALALAVVGFRTAPSRQTFNYSTAVYDAVRPLIITECIEELENRHYARPFDFRSVTHRQNGWRDDHECADDCYNSGSICNGCGSEKCRELPPLRDLLTGCGNDTTSDTEGKP